MLIISVKALLATPDVKDVVLIVKALGNEKERIETEHFAQVGRRWETSLLMEVKTASVELSCTKA